MLWLRVFVLLCIQLYFLDQASACRCAPYLHSQNAFCDPFVDVVIKAKIKKKVTIGNNIIIKLKKTMVFKNSTSFNDLPNEAKKKAYTLVGPSACEAGMDKKKTYVFTGKVGSGKLWVSSCDYIKLWKDLKAFEKKNFQSVYKNNCGCKFDQVGGAPPPFPFPPTTCILISTQVSCGVYAYCQCNDYPCTHCSMVTKQPHYKDCASKFPLPP